ncbi:uncharacterized protein LOC127723556 [Mytilus californianus]|uniref:uncharacterized protein LOC127723556 n=1 Tax=Mytilus californianus TaxID=6549 RepID=UPI002245D9D6|nr:uncharacterized protein LOC127723556 [Mytilus californianus]
MSGLMQFFMSVEIKNDTAVYIEPLLSEASCAIADQAIFKFRVIGEPKIVAIFEVEDATVLNRVTAEIMASGSFTVTCSPLSCYESWAKILGVDEKFTGPAPRKLTGKYVSWFDITLEHHGIPLEQFVEYWRDEAASILELRSKGQIEIEIFKVLGERRLHAFSCKDNPEEWEGLTLKLPMWVKMGDQIYKKTKLVTKM